MSTEIVYVIVGVVLGWVFQAGMIYAGFQAMRRDLQASRTWQNSHELKDDKRFMATIAVFAATTDEAHRQNLVELLRSVTP